MPDTGLVAEFDIRCERLPLVGVAAAVPAATVVLELQFNHGERPLFLVTVTDGERATVERALVDAVDVGAFTLVGRAQTRRRTGIPGRRADRPRLPIESRRRFVLAAGDRPAALSASALT